MERFIKSPPRTRYREPFVLVSHPYVPYENNTARRSMRHPVTGRKIGDKTRSEQGTSGKRL